MAAIQNSHYQRVGRDLLAGSAQPLRAQSHRDIERDLRNAEANPPTGQAKTAFAKWAKGLEGQMRKWEVTHGNVLLLNLYNSVQSTVLGEKRFYPPLFKIDHELQEIENGLVTCFNADQIKDLQRKMAALRDKHLKLSPSDKKTKYFKETFTPRFEKLGQKIPQLKPKSSLPMKVIEALTYLAPIYAAYQYGIPQFILTTLAVEWIQYEAQGAIKNPLHHPLEYFHKVRFTTSVATGLFYLRPHLPFIGTILSQMWNDRPVFHATWAFALWRLKNNLPTINTAKTWFEKWSLIGNNLAFGGAMGALVGHAVQPLALDIQTPLENLVAPIVNITRSLWP